MIERSSQALLPTLGLFLALSFFALLPSLLVVAQEPGILTVTTLADELNEDGDCSLREAIQSVNLGQSMDACEGGAEGITLRLPAGIYTLTLAGAHEDENSTGDLDLRGTLTLEGEGPGDTILDAGALDRALHIHAGAAVTLRGVAVRGGQTPSVPGNWGIPVPAEGGGGIYNAGRLTVTDTLIQENATGNGSTSMDGGRGGAGGDGGGLYNAGTLLIERSTIRANRTGNGGEADNGGAGGAGGGLFNLGTLAINQSTILGNRTGKGGEAILRGGHGGDGGGLFSDSDVPVTIRDSVIRENGAGLGGRGATIQDGLAGAGGGLYLIGGGGTIVNTVVLSNQSSSRGSGLILRGGASHLLALTVAQNGGGEGVGLLTAGDVFELPTVVRITNTIVVSQSMGILGEGRSTTLDGVLWFNNKSNSGGSITVTNEYTGSPDFAADGFHLRATSWAIDRGVSGADPADIDGEPRQGRPDLGADEFQGIVTSPTPLPSPTAHPEERLYLPLLRR